MSDTRPLKSFGSKTKKMSRCFLGVLEWVAQCHQCRGHRTNKSRPLSLSQFEWNLPTLDAVGFGRTNILDGIVVGLYDDWGSRKLVKITSKRGCLIKRGRCIPHLFGGHSHSIPQGMIFDVRDYT